MGVEVDDEPVEPPEERREVVGERLGDVGQLVELVEGPAQLDERRVGAAERPRQEAERLGEGDVLVRDRPEGRVRVGDEAGDIVTPLGQSAPTSRETSIRKRSKTFWSADSSRITAAVVESEGPKYLKVRFSSSPLPTYQPEKPVSTF